MCRGRNRNEYIVIGGTTGFSYNMHVHLLHIDADAEVPVAQLSKAQLCFCFLNC
jgi:hypothetical protein